MTERPVNPYGGTEPPRFDEPTTTRTSSPPTPLYPSGDGPSSADLSGPGTDQSGTDQSGTGSDNSATDTAKQEARQVADTATSAGAGVAQTAKDQATEVAAETKHQAASLLDTVRSEVGQQAGTQQQRIAEAVHSLSKELGSMASSSSESGWVTDLVQEASRRGGELSHWLQDREPADVLEAVRSYARRRPGTFLIICGVAGIVAGRLTRSAVATRTSLDSSDDDDQPRALTSGRSEPRYTGPAVQPPSATTSAGPSIGTVASDTSTLTEPTATGAPDPLATSDQDPLARRGQDPLLPGARDPLAPGGDPTR